MSEKYHYDKNNKYIGKTSDKPPSSNLGGIVFFLLILVILVKSCDSPKNIDSKNSPKSQTQNNTTSNTAPTNSSGNLNNKIIDHSVFQSNTVKENLENTIKEEEKTYSDEEILEMENEKNYHGDDPIVRARLGLPPRNN